MAYVKGWAMPKVEDLIELFIAPDILNKTKVSAHVVLMEKFFNSKQKQFAKVYLKITGASEIRTARTMAAGRSSMNQGRRLVYSSPSEQDPTARSNHHLLANLAASSSNDDLLFKIRTAFFKGAVPVFRQNIVNILERTWTSKLDKKQFELQNGLRVLIYIKDVSHYLTNKNEDTYGYTYTISINGQDPEFLGIKEPTFSDFMHQTRLEKEKSIEFCPCSAFEIERVYFRLGSNMTESVFKNKLARLLNKVWHDMNADSRERGLTSNRVTVKNKLDNSYFSVQSEKLIRLAMTWLVDGASPNPIYFKRPSIQDMMPYFVNHSLSVYDGIPLINQSLSLSRFNGTEQIRAGLMKAWQKANPSVRADVFYLRIEDRDNGELENLDDEKEESFIHLIDEDSTSVESNRTSTTSGLLLNNKRRNAVGPLIKSPTILNYYVGVNDKTFDAGEIQQPSLRMIMEEVRNLAPDTTFEKEFVAPVDQPILVVPIHKDNNPQSNNKNINLNNREKQPNGDLIDDEIHLPGHVAKKKSITMVAISVIGGIIVVLGLTVLIGLFVRR